MIGLLSLVLVGAVRVKDPTPETTPPPTPDPNNEQVLKSCHNIAESDLHSWVIDGETCCPIWEDNINGYDINNVQEGLVLVEIMEKGQWHDFDAIIQKDGFSLYGPMDVAVDEEYHTIAFHDIRAMHIYTDVGYATKLLLKAGALGITQVTDTVLTLYPSDADDIYWMEALQLKFDKYRWDVTHCPCQKPTPTGDPDADRVMLTLHSVLCKHHTSVVGPEEYEFVAELLGITSNSVDPHPDIVSEKAWQSNQILKQKMLAGAAASKNYTMNASHVPFDEYVQTQQELIHQGLDDGLLTDMCTGLSDADLAKPENADCVALHDGHDWDAGRRRRRSPVGDGS